MTLTAHSFRANVRPWLLALVLVLASVFPVSLLFREGPQSSVGADGQVSGKQGEVVLVRVPVKDRPDRVEGRFLKRTLTFSPSRKRRTRDCWGWTCRTVPAGMNSRSKSSIPNERNVGACRCW